MKHTSLKLLLISTMLMGANAYAADNTLQVPDSLGKVAEIGDKAAEQVSENTKEAVKSAEANGLPDLSAIPALPGDVAKEEKPAEEKKADSASVPPPVALPTPGALPTPSALHTATAEAPADKKDTPPAVASEPAKPATEETKPFANEAKPTAEEEKPAAVLTEKLPEPDDSLKPSEPAKPAEAPTSASLPSMTPPPPGSFPKLSAPSSFALPSPDGSPVIPTEEPAALEQQTAPEVAHPEVAPNTEIEKPAAKKVVHKKKKKPVDMAKRYKNRLPDTIYASTYPKGNKHLPKARYEQELDAQVFTAIKKDNINGLRALLDYSKRNINQVNVYGDTPLIYAVKNNAVNSVRVLIGRKADLNAVDAQGLTALDNAKRLGNYRVVRALTIMNVESDKVATGAVSIPVANAFSPIELSRQ